MHLETPPEVVKALTRLWDGERFPNGRPKVPDDIIQRMKLVTTEEAWGVLRRNGYHRQFEGNWLVTHPEQILVGRAVTTMFIPHRPDFHDLVQEIGDQEGRIGGQNSWVIDTLEPNDVMVVDMFGKIVNGTSVGDNLSTSVRARTKAGAVIEGGIRDYQGIVKLTDVNFYFRGMDPSAISDVTLLGINMPIRIGGTTVLPGDVVLGTPTGISFIPAHLAQAVVERSEDVRVRDEFGKQRLQEGKYTPGEIDRAWPEHIEADFQEWLAQRQG